MIQDLSKVGQLFLGKVGYEEMKELAMERKINTS